MCKKKNTLFSDISHPTQHSQGLLYKLVSLKRKNILIRLILFNPHKLLGSLQLNMPSRSTRFSKGTGHGASHWQWPVRALAYACKIWDDALPCLARLYNTSFLAMCLVCSCAAVLELVFLFSKRLQDSGKKVFCRLVAVFSYSSVAQNLRHMGAQERVDLPLLWQHWRHLQEKRWKEQSRLETASREKPTW